MREERERKVLYFDIDGTITKETEGWDYINRTPDLEVIDILNTMFFGGLVEITLWTARLEIDREVTKEWLSKHNVNYHNLVLGKPFFHLYVCDRVQNIKEFKRMMVSQYENNIKG